MRLQLSLTLLLALSACAEVDIDDILDRSQAKLQSQLQDRFESSGGHTSRAYKSTDFSRSMDYRNALFEQAALLLRQESSLLTDQQAEDLINSGLQRLADRQKQGSGSGGVGDCGSRLIDEVNSACSTQQPACNASSPYRTITGVCNNLQHPFWGSLNIAHRRFLPARYANGVGEPFGRTETRITRRGDPLDRQSSTSLPSPRFISHTFHTDVDLPDPNHALLLMQFGQFVDHDLTLTPNADDTGCCQAGGFNAGNCFSITVPRNDPFISLNNLNCLTFTRSTAFCQSLTNTREQMNVLTAFIDGSNVYGSDDAKSRLLRTLQGGRMKTSLSASGKVLLPSINGALMAGDTRAIEMPELATIHTIFLREHNRIAAAIAAARPGLSDDQIFFKTRSLVGAELQNIVYGQFHGEILGQSTQDQLGLSITSGFSTYNPTVDPSIRNSFATAAYRFGHTLIQGMIKPRNLQTGNVQNSFLLRNAFFNTSNYFGQSGNGAEEILFGIMDENTQTYDQFITQEVTNFLLFDVGSPRSDLIARNLQRSRDHGLPGYLAFRQFCGLSSPCSWSDRPAEISQTKWNQLSQIYNQPEDIELFTGGISEASFNGGVLGRTFNCIIGRQFKAIKDGDRFFFTHQGQAGSFNSAQLQNLRSRNFGDIICDNTGISATALNVFRKDSPMRSCSLNNKLNISLFL